MDCQNNTITGDVGKKTPKYGVLLTDCATGCTVKGNKITATYGPGVAITRTNNCQVTNNTIKDTYDNGIQVTDASNVTVANNSSVSKYNVNFDIRVNKGVKSSKVENNTIGGRGVSVDRASNATNVNNKAASGGNSSGGSSSGGNSSGGNANTGGKSRITWSRLSGGDAYATMQAVVMKGFSKADTVVVATFSGYWDALSASALAGKHNAPILLTDPNSLSATTRSEINRLGAKTVYIAGGSAVVSEAVKKQIQALPSVKSVKRVSGGDAQATANAIAAEVGKSVTGIGIVATSNGYWDALAASPYAYAYKAPVFLTDPTGTIRDDVVKAMKQAGVKKAIIAGGAAAVNGTTVNKLKAAGISVERKYGDDAVATSAAFAQWAIKQGMKADKMGVATTGGFYDALTGSALCGKNNSVLVLASPDSSAGATTVIKANKSKMTTGYVFGGKAAVSDKILNEINLASK